MSNTNYKRCVRCNYQYPDEMFKVEGEHFLSKKCDFCRCVKLTEAYCRCCIRQYRVKYDPYGKAIRECSQCIKIGKNLGCYDKEKHYLVRKYLLHNVPLSFLENGVYAGGSGNYDGTECISSDRHLYYKQYYKHIFEIPETEKNCLCSHHIEEQCYIFDTKTKQVGIVGNTCIDYFCRRFCIECSTETYKIDKKRNICHDCTFKKKFPDKSRDRYFSLRSMRNLK